VCWAFSRERERVVQILEDSVLSNSGVIEPRLAITALDRAAAGQTVQDAQWLYNALSLDTWLLVRAGRYRTARADSSVVNREQRRCV
jgi:hypothetical protein